MKKTTILYLLVLSNLINAQVTTNLKVTESATYKDKVFSTGVLSINTSDNGETGIIRNSRKGFLFDVFNTKFQKTYSKIIAHQKKERFVGDLFYGNTLKFFSVHIVSRNEREIYSYTLDFANKTQDKKLLFKTFVDRTHKLFGLKNRHKTSFAISPNHKYYAIATDNVLKNKNSYTIRVFDVESDALIYEKSYLKDTENKYQQRDLIIDNDATVYSLGKLHFKPKKRFYRFVLNKITKNSTSEIVLTHEEGINIQELSLSKVENELHLIGFYSRSISSHIKGGCDFIINLDKFKQTGEKFNTLPKEVYADLYPKNKAKRKNKKKKQLRNFFIDYAVKDSESNTYITAEEFYITYRNAPTAAGQRSTPVYHYDNILILKFSKNGDLLWGRSILKKAHVSSYNVFVKDGKFHVILNSGKHLLIKDDGRTQVSRGIFESSSLYDIEYAEDGKVQYNKIQDNRKNNKYFPHFGTYGAGKFIMMSGLFRKKNFMILE